MNDRLGEGSWVIIWFGQAAINVQPTWNYNEILVTDSDWGIEAFWNIEQNGDICLPFLDVAFLGRIQSKTRYKHVTQNVSVLTAVCDFLLNKS